MMPLKFLVWGSTTETLCYVCENDLSKISTKIPGYIPEKPVPMWEAPRLHCLTRAPFQSRLYHQGPASSHNQCSTMWALRRAEILNKNKAVTGGDGRDGKGRGGEGYGSIFQRKWSHGQSVAKHPNTTGLSLPCSRRMIGASPAICSLCTHSLYFS